MDDFAAILLVSSFMELENRPSPQRFGKARPIGDLNTNIWKLMIVYLMRLKFCTMLVLNDKHQEIMD